jgi:hypothetical protein
MLEEVEQLINVIKLAHKRGAYSLEESSIIYQLLQGVNKCPALQKKQTMEQGTQKDLDVIMEDVEI